MKILTRIAVIMSLATTPLFAQNVQGEDDVDSAVGSNAALRDLVDYSDGYVNIRDNVVLVEGESSIQVCNFDLKPEFFMAMRDSDAPSIAMNQPNVTCVPLASFAVNETPNTTVDSPMALMELVDNSESYVRMRDNILMIEGEEAIEFCLFELPAELFAAAASGDQDAMVANRGTVTCVPFEDVAK